jgi:hypothetical protein
MINISGDPGGYHAEIIPSDTNQQPPASIAWDMGGITEAVLIREEDGRPVRYEFQIGDCTLRRRVLNRQSQWQPSEEDETVIQLLTPTDPPQRAPLPDGWPSLSEIMGRSVHACTPRRTFLNRPEEGLPVSNRLLRQWDNVGIRWDGVKRTVLRDTSPDELIADIPQRDTRAEQVEWREAIESDRIVDIPPEVFNLPIGRTLRTMKKMRYIAWYKLNKVRYYAYVSTRRLVHTSGRHSSAEESLERAADKVIAMDIIDGTQPPQARISWVEENAYRRERPFRSGVGLASRLTGTMIDRLTGQGREDTREYSLSASRTIAPGDGEEVRVLEYIPDSAGRHKPERNIPLADCDPHWIKERLRQAKSMI